MSNPIRRRSILAAGAALTAGLAGCIDAFDAENDPSEDGSAGDDDSTGDDPAGDDPADEDEPNDEPTPSSGSDDELLFSVERDGRRREAVTVDQLAHHGAASFDQRTGTHYVHVELDESGRDDFADALAALEAFDDPVATEIHTYREGAVVESHRLGRNLAQVIQSGEFDGSMRTIFADENAAREFADWLSTHASDDDGP